MWRRVLQTLTAAFRRSSVPMVDGIKADAQNGIIGSSSSGSSSIQSNISPEKQKAFDELNKAMKELRSISGTTPLQPDVKINAPTSSDGINSRNVSIKETQMNQLSTSEIESLARDYYEGANGLSKSLERAVELWRIGASRDSIESKYSLAACLNDGQGVPQNFGEAFKLMKELADNHKYHLAHNALGHMYYHGQGTEVDYAQSFLHYKEAGRAGIAPAVYNMANAYASGQGVPKNESAAFKCYEIAADSGDTSAKFKMGTWLYNGRGCEKDLVRAFRFQKEAADTGHPMAMYNIGFYYLSGSGVTKDYNQAAQWFQQCIKVTDMVQPRVNLARLYMMGLGVPVDYQMARSLVIDYVDKNPDCKEMVETIDSSLIDKK